MSGPVGHEDDAVTDAYLSRDEKLLKDFCGGACGLKDLMPPAWAALVPDKLWDDLDLLEDDLRDALRQAAKEPVFPAFGDWFRALKEVAPEDVRVVIIGQDPYYSPMPDDPARGVADGLAFSLRFSSKPQGSLDNIFREAGVDASARKARYDLTSWARQGVLLLNTVLTVKRGKANSHQGLGWQQLTTQLIAALSRARQRVVFMAWGTPARNVARAVDMRKGHLVLTASHPSPRGAHLTATPFIGCDHFRKANAFLESHGLKPVAWDA